MHNVPPRRINRSRSVSTSLTTDCRLLVPRGVGLAELAVAVLEPVGDAGRLPPRQPQVDRPLLLRQSPAEEPTPPRPRGGAAALRPRQRRVDAGLLPPRRRSSHVRRIL